jgi:hypothetical protein
VAKLNLSRMDFEAPVKLCEQVEDALISHRATLEKQLEALGGSIASFGEKIARGGGGSILNGKTPRPILEALNKSIPVAMDRQTLPTS